MEIIVVMNKKEENAVLTAVGEFIEKKISFDDVWEKHCKIGSIQVNPQEENLNVLINVHADFVVDTIDLYADLMKSCMSWVTKYMQKFADYVDKWESANDEVEKITE